ncbi:hypothetical protein A3K42_01140 [candidate division WWE3 bacterium RBG_13_37_7]|uniref:mRNA interferase n=1 Tax=candidate division WWE3 bacterium RBG_13_37_7 TaxID=1802609 RepID=A0A1F4U151_UNCKA|nr:MAG: hypothetical protein A3K42_01140 [candidate division WWE3 bacterium RBG_13_37_7]
MKYKFGDVYLVKFHPAMGQELHKYRPAVILSDKTNEIDSRFVTIAPFTTKISKSKNFEILFKTSEVPFLDKNSLLLLWYIRTTEIDSLEVKLGEISDIKKKELKNNLVKLFS